MKDFADTIVVVAGLMLVFAVLILGILWIFIP